MSLAAVTGEGERQRPPIASTQGLARGCGGPARAALLGLAPLGLALLLGLVLYLVRAGPLVAWLAVGATAVWWRLSREFRGPRAAPLPSFVRSQRRQRTRLVSPLANAAANGKLLEPRTLFKGLKPAQLLLMGSYLDKSGPPQPATAQEGRDLKERPVRRLPTRSSPPTPAAQRVPQRGYPSLPTPFHGPPRRSMPRECGTLANPFVIAPPRRYPIQQAQYSMLGVLPTVCWDGCQKKAVLSVRNSKMVCSPGTVRIAPPDSRLTRRLLPGQLINSTLPSPSGNVPDSGAKENDLREGKKRIAEEDHHLLDDGQENKRRRQSPSGPLVANGVSTSSVPNSGSLKRVLPSQSSGEHSSKRSCTSRVSSLTSTCGVRCSGRNAIASSYSSTLGISRQQLWKRSGSISSPFSSPASSPERPAKKAREEEPRQHSRSSTTPRVANKESQGQRAVDTPAQKPPNSGASPSTPGSSRQRKRKIPLLPRRRNQLTLPSPPQLGYPITAEDFDLEKKASLQWLNKVLEDKTDVPRKLVSEKPPDTQPSFTLPAASTTSSAASWPAVGTSLKKTQSVPGPSLPEPSPLKTPSLLDSLGSLPSGPLPVTSSDSKPTATFLGLVPASSTAPVADTKTPPALQADTSTPSPMQGVLFGGMSKSETSDPSSPGALAMSSASPTVKPIFAMAPKSESEGPLPSSLAKLPTMTSTATSTFKPIFSDLGPPVAVPLSAPFSFKPTTAVTAAAAPAAPLFAGLATATSVVASTTTTTTSVSKDSSSKSAFGFGVNSVASTGSSTTSSMTSASQLFPFGVPSASVTSSARAMGSEFQFGRAPIMQTSTAVTTFGQSLPGAVQMATTTTSSSSSSSSIAGFRGLGGSLTTSALAATCQPTLTFSNTTTPAFNIPFGLSAKHPVAAYPIVIPQPKFGAANGQQQRSTKPALIPSFGSPFPFGNSGAPAPSVAPVLTPMSAPASALAQPAQPAFGSSAQTGFGLKTTASAFSVPASTKKAFGVATTSGFRATTHTTSSGTSSSVFGSSTSSPLMFGGPVAPSVGLSVAAPDTNSTSGAFNFGPGQSGTTGTTTPFVGVLSQNALGIPRGGTPFAFNVASTSESKPVYGSISTPTFGRSTLTAGVGTAGNSLSFGVSSIPTQGFVGVGSFGSAAPSFSIGAGPKTPGARPRLQARRQHTRKK
ncbi:nuclear envelope pore membrane protein POM 121C-like [Urocitellus parryii]|uniref:Nuclear envelope pore membrane protein POM 121C-like n=1 Tax=Urocitellus parryii TaxID=9999 RepID=A0A8D2HYQ8_UROPR|nr:nuclear envelope pore membrane protein POM 121C-like [Urocitellus parryii]